MELSLRLNYTKYITQSNTVSESDESEYRYIDPPLEWFRIFDIDSNAQDLRDEIDLICNEIVDGIQDWSQFGSVSAAMHGGKAHLRLIKCTIVGTADKA